MSFALAGPDLTQYTLGGAVGAYTPATDFGSVQTTSRVYASVTRTAQNTFSATKQTGISSWDADGFTAHTYEADGIPVFYLVLGAA